MTVALHGCGQPSVGQAWFSDALYARCKCRIAWHRLRRVFVVYRSRGAHARPLTFIDLGPNCWPLTSAVLDLAVDAVRWADARANQDPDRMLEIINRRHSEAWEKENSAFVDERLPDFMADVRRIREIITDGRRREKFHDLGALRRAG